MLQVHEYLITGGKRKTGTLFERGAGGSHLRKQLLVQGRKGGRERGVVQFARVAPVGQDVLHKMAVCTARGVKGFHEYLTVQ